MLTVVTSSPRHVPSWNTIRWLLLTSSLLPKKASPIWSSLNCCNLRNNWRSKKKINSIQRHRPSDTTTKEKYIFSDVKIIFFLIPQSLLHTPAFIHIHFHFHFSYALNFRWACDKVWDALECQRLSNLFRIWNNQESSAPTTESCWLKQFDPLVRKTKSR